jgi:hypothetical protein
MTMYNPGKKSQSAVPVSQRLGSMTRLALTIAGWLLALYLLIFIPSFAIEETRFLMKPDYVYIYNDAPRSIYTTGPQHAAYGMSKLGPFPDQIFIVDGSTAAQAFIHRNSPA